MPYPKNSKLIARLIDQKDSILTGGYNYLTVFELFSRHVEQELKQINILFEEYTPHDDTHMDSLFRIADELLGESINALNGCEACILACSIYGHDWGMAVSAAEQHLITQSECNQTNYALLPDEKYRWLEFCRKNGIYNDLKDEFDSSKITKDLWRDYVRHTHAQRARARCEKFFKDDLSPLGPVIGQICEAHWYDIEEIRGLHSSYSLAGVTVNIRALATYIRFIDLLDIGNNRTPYALWKFINPSNSISKIEWKKHSAINPITFRKENNNDIILQIHGIVTDIETYSSLQDMRRYVTKQVKENCELLKGEKNKSLGNIEIDWNVTTDGSFEPIDIRFEFDREGMFRLLSGEIYNNDPYVFIRELVQNAIDATQLRFDLHLKERTGIQFRTDVEINIKHLADGDAIFEIKDSGVGMTADIVKNYLSVLGKSYYRSKDYLSLSLKIQPISKFGVGLFSCFEVADKIVIKTGTDSNLKNYGSEVLEIEISNPSQQFRVKKISTEKFIGTIVRVYLKGTKWKKSDYKNTEKLNFTKYLKDVASMVKFALIIDEDGIITEIKPPVLSNEKCVAEEKSKNNIFIKSSDSWLETVVDPDDIHVAKRVLAEKRRNFTIDHHGLNIEGVLQEFELSENVIFWRRGTSRCANGIGERGHTYTLIENGIISEVEIHSLDTANYHPKDNLSKSTKHDISCEIFMNGFLLPEQKIRVYGSESVPTPRLVMNITESEECLSINLSRLNVNNSLEYLSEIINDELIKCYEPDYSSHSLIERFSIITNGRCRVRSKNIIEDMPILQLMKNGILEFTNAKHLPNEIEISPAFYFKIQNRRVGWPPEQGQWPPIKWLTSPLKNAESIIDLNTPMIVQNLGMEYDDGSCMGWNIYHNNSSSVINKHYTTASYRLKKIENIPYLIEKKVRSQPPENKSEKKIIDTFLISFSNFEGDLNNFICAIKLKNDQIMPNKLFGVVLNRNDRFIKLIEKTIQKINENPDQFSDDHHRRVNILYRMLPFANSIPDYQPHIDYSKIIHDWVLKFCLGCADLGLIILDEDERSILKTPKPSIVCRE